MKLLIAEDDKQMRDLFIDIAENIGYEVESADDGKKALNLFDKDYPDVVLTDFQMPFLNGEDFAIHIDERYRPDWTGKVILCTFALGLVKNPKLFDDIFSKNNIQGLKAKLKEYYSGEGGGMMKVVAIISKDETLKDLCSRINDKQTFINGKIDQMIKQIKKLKESCLAETKTEWIAIEAYLRSRGEIPNDFDSDKNEKDQIGFNMKEDYVYIGPPDNPYSGMQGIMLQFPPNFTPQ